jgi:hypothetical protein
MSDPAQHERELRAARNQSLFRAINDKMKSLNQAFVLVSNDFTIACECADVNCLEMIDIGADAYEAVRAEPRQFAVLPGHVYPEVESVVAEHNGYVIVEKRAAAGEAAEQIAEVTAED